VTKALELLLAELREHPRDARLLSKIAELQLRSGDRHDGIMTLLQLAAVYHGDGFGLKAAAVLKQVTKLSPGNMEGLRILATQYESLGLTADAIAAFREMLRVARLQRDLTNATRALRNLQRLGCADEVN